MRRRQAARAAARKHGGCERLRDGSGAGVEQNVGQLDATARRQRLVNLIERRVSRDQRDRGERPRKMRLAAPSPDPAEDEEAQDEIFRDVARLAQEVVDEFQRVRRSAREEPMQKRNDEAAGVLG